MKKLILLSLLSVNSLFAVDLDNYLSDNYNELFDTELQKSFYDSKFNSLSWVSPIVLSFQRTWNTKIEGSSSPMNSYSIGIDQPIFKSGGIYYGIKFAKANYHLANANIVKKRQELIAKAIELLYKIRQTKLRIQKLKLQIANSRIEIDSKDELFNAGLVGSVDLDRAMANRDEAEIAMLDMKANLEELKGAFRKLSSKNPEHLRLPKLRMLSKSRFLSSNTELDVANAEALAKEYQAKMTRSKYLPTVSVGARYTKVSKAQPFTKDKFANYSLTVSMPISLNVGNDLERAKLDTMISKIKARNSQKSAVEDYKIVAKKVAIIDRRVALAKKEARVYARLLRSIRNLYKAGQKSKRDVDAIRNSLKIKQLDAKIYRIQKQIELLKLYAKVR